MKKLDFIYFDAGGGHRAAANALRQTVERQERPWEVRMVNLQEELDRIDLFRKFTGLRLQDVYNLMLKRGWTLGSPQLTVGMHFLIRLFHREQVRILEALWTKSRPDMVVSLVPNFNRALVESLQAALPGTPLVTVLTDLADYPPHFWLEPVEQYIVCGSGRAVEQAVAMGHRRERIFLVSGMVLNPRFYETAPLAAEERARERRRLGFDPEVPVGMVLFGGHGAPVMIDIARRLPERQLLLICGHSGQLAARLRALPHRAPLFTEGFTKEIPHYMQLADYFIGKPGPGSISEAIRMHLPVIVECNAWTLPQERYNAEWIREHGVGLVLRSFRGIGDAVDVLLREGNYERFQSATEQLRNRAVYEIPDILQGILESTKKAMAI